LLTHGLATTSAAVIPAPRPASADPSPGAADQWRRIHLASEVAIRTDLPVTC
jgi:hypothetical protein